MPACPVDCIAMVDVTGARTGWEAWSAPQADAARQRYAFHRMRVEREQRENDERLAAKAQTKLADLRRHSAITDPRRSSASAPSSRPRWRAPRRSAAQ